MVWEWAVAYLITCAVEVPLIVVLVRGLGWRAERAPGSWLMAWLLQLTHPVLWLAGPVEVWALAIAEVVVTVVEATGLYWWATVLARQPGTATTAESALLIAVIANAASLLTGLAFCWLTTGPA